MMDGIQQLMMFVWVIGWLYTSGIHSWNIYYLEKTNGKTYSNGQVLLHYIAIFLFWPIFLGYHQS